VQNGLFETLSALIVSGRRFTEEDILSVRSSKEYAECSFIERAFIEELFKDYSEPPNKRRKE
jgi:hypothetical protein